ncbi:unnamed protein product, partial [Darwinula stevensoni]
MPPQYSFGTWLARMSYADESQVMEVARVAREKRFPADVIHVDITWFDKSWRCDWRFSPTRFPDPKAMITKLNTQGFKFTVWQNPYVLKGTWAWDEAVEKGYLATSHKVPFVFVGVYEGLPIDFTNPEAATWYRERLLKPLFEQGVSAIKTDFGEGIHPSMTFKAGNGKKIHNLYPMLYNRAAYTAAKDYFGEEEAMVWGRSGYAGSQRYPVVWSGDNSATFGSMMGSLHGGLNLGLSGFTFWSQDTGGFVGTPTDELMVQYQDDPSTYNIDDQFMCGDHLLVAPILTTEWWRRVYLPKGLWYDFWTGQSYQGGQWLTVNSPLETIPLFVKAGSLIPLAQVVQSTQDLSLDKMTLHAFGDQNGQSHYELWSKTEQIPLKADHTKQILQTHLSVQEVIWRNS